MEFPIEDNKVAEVLIDTSKDPQHWLLGTAVLSKPGDYMALLEAKDALREVLEAHSMLPEDGVVFEEDAFEIMEVTSDRQWAEDKSWDRLQRDLGKRDINEVRLGDWFSNYSRNVMQPKVRDESSNEAEAGDNCKQCGNEDDIFYDPQSHEFTCGQCGAIRSEVNTRDIAAIANNGSVIRKHIYYAHLHFRGALMGIQGQAPCKRVPFKELIKRRLATCADEKEAREVLKSMGLARLYSKASTLLADSRPMDLPAFSRPMLEYLENRHKFWHFVFKSMEIKPRKYFFNTKYMFLRLMQEAGFYHEAEKQIERYKFAVTSTIIGNEIAWRKLVIDAKRRGFVDSDYKYNILPCYKDVVRAYCRRAIQRKRRREATSTGDSDAKRQVQ